MTLRELRKLLQSGDRKLYQRSIQKLIKRIADRYSKLEPLLLYLKIFDAKPDTGSITTAPDIAKEKRPKGQKQSSHEAPTVGALRANGLLYILN
jgi:hypothetical protein